MYKCTFTLYSARRTKMRDSILSLTTEKLDKLKVSELKEHFNTLGCKFPCRMPKADLQDLLWAEITAQSRPGK